MQTTENLSEKPADPAENDSLLPEVVLLIINAVNLHHIDPQTIKPETSLRQGGLELDSVDILEVIVTIEHKYGVKITDAETGKKVFRSIGSIVEFIRAQKPAVP